MGGAGPFASLRHCEGRVFHDAGWSIGAMGVRFKCDFRSCLQRGGQGRAAERRRVPCNESFGSRYCNARTAFLECVAHHTWIHIMRTNIVIDDKLMANTLRATGLKTKREVVELGLRTLLRLRQQEEIKRFRGRLSWQGDLGAMRADK